jgi:hypothetical protein
MKIPHLTKYNILTEKNNRARDNLLFTENIKTRNITILELATLYNCCISKMWVYDL